ncbi:MAG: nucleotidyltransferase family protein [Clostridia bacterium]|nr:nucleotidyltransferase family protein [Clostridia bacterium]
MKCLILAAGYATRLYPLTENFPKPLLPVGGKTILDWLLEDIDSSGETDEYIVISNHRFISCFADWARDLPYKITVIDDGTISNETRLGAVRDILFAVDTLYIDDDLLVVAGDNVLDFSLTEFISYALNKGTSCIMRYYEPLTEKLRKCGVVTVDGSDLVTGMVEKPSDPKSNWCCPPFYYITESDSRRLAEAIAAGCGTDAPGSFFAWLQSVSPVHAMEMPGLRYDVGDLESYERIKNFYRGITK